MPNTVTTQVATCTWLRYTPETTPGAGATIYAVVTCGESWDTATPDAKVAGAVAANLGFSSVVLMHADGTEEDITVAVQPVVQPVEPVVAPVDPRPVPVL